MHNQEIIELKLGNFLIQTSSDLDGYGYQTVIDAVSCFNHFSNGKKYNHCLEWCSGPGYLGFGTLSHGLTKKLTLLDIFEPNKTVVENTIKQNNLSETVNFILSDNFLNHKKTIKYDLVIGNPPHFNFSHPPTKGVDINEHRKYQDTDWKIHRDFFENINDYITDDADIILMENIKGSDLNTFKDMIESNGLKIKDYCLSVEYPNDIWYLHITKI